MTALATAIYENEAIQPMAETNQDYRNHVQYQLAGVSNLHIYAAMRGEPLEEFLKTRNQPGGLYSVAGKDATKLEWEQSVAGKLS